MSIMKNPDGVRYTEIPKDYSDGRTKQSFKDETDVNVIIKKHARMGTLSHLEQWGGQYGDFSDFDFHEAQNRIAQGTSMFEQLPSSVRNQFRNDPAAFFDFVTDQENAGQLEKLLPELAESRDAPLPTARDMVDPEPAPEAPSDGPDGP